MRATTISRKSGGRGSDDPREVTAFLQPYMDLMSWDVRAVYERQYNDAEIESLRQVAKQTG